MGGLMDLGLHVTDVCLLFALISGAGTLLAYTAIRQQSP
jgi:hypothetical protein